MFNAILTAIACAIILWLLWMIAGLLVLPYYLWARYRDASRPQATQPPHD